MRKISILTAVLLFFTILLTGCGFRRERGFLTLQRVISTIIIPKAIRTLGRYPEMSIYLKRYRIFCMLRLSRKWRFMSQEP